MEPNYERDRDRAIREKWRETGEPGIPYMLWYFGMTKREKRIDPPSSKFVCTACSPLKARRLASLIPNVTTKHLRARLQRQVSTQRPFGDLPETGGGLTALRVRGGGT